MNESAASAGRAARASRTLPERVRWSGDKDTKAITSIGHVNEVDE